MSKPVLGVILSQFPRYDEAFILRELVQLAQGQWTLRILSLRPCRDAVIHEQARALVPQTAYAPFLKSAALWRAHGYYLRARPAAYWGALGWILSRHWAHPLILVKTLALFPKTVYFARLCKAEGIRHVHAFWATYPATSAIVIGRLTGATYSLSGHAHDIYTANPALEEKLRGAQFALTCTEANRDHLVQLVDRGNGRAPHADRILVSYHGVDLARFAPAPKPDEGRCRILSVGSLLPCKGLETLIQACALLKIRGIPFDCTIAGGGPLERTLRGMIREHGLEAHVAIAGYVSQETVVGHYQRATVFAMPLVSRIHWGIPNVLIEALATQTPVITCALPSLKELVVDGRSGLIIPEQRPAALADAIGRLWADPALRQRLAAEGFRRVQERFALDRTGAALREAFGRVVGAGGG
jgi:glycosyltransferase involved in cell wall biosynthesis